MVLFFKFKNRKRDYITEDEIIVIISNAKEYYIVASVISVLKNDLSYMELPIHCFLHDDK